MEFDPINPDLSQVQYRLTAPQKSQLTYRVRRAVQSVHIVSPASIYTTKDSCIGLAYQRRTYVALSCYAYIARTCGSYRAEQCIISDASVSDRKTDLIPMQFRV
ncbi:hypothetical protein MJO28_011802 [Puccinia striiformis f. sp. tritici]|uniref:Uncharacterized protein n=1 Tax=Puccinia striiformis f. sp. tritici TaxID=168172 RepID=A0ACC0E4R7_9BASI|nr:hypothetical protein MJO28_011802 [Puccinia striiformis f. sp. tritici]